MNPSHTIFIGGPWAGRKLDGEGARIYEAQTRTGFAVYYLREIRAHGVDVECYLWQGLEDEEAILHVLDAYESQLAARTLLLDNPGLIALPDENGWSAGTMDNYKSGKGATMLQAILDFLSK